MQNCEQIFAEQKWFSENSCHPKFNLQFLCLNSATILLRK